METVNRILYLFLETLQNKVQSCYKQSNSKNKALNVVSRFIPDMFNASRKLSLILCKAHQQLSE